MKTDFLDHPLYRFFNVLFLIGYIAVILVALLAGYIGYSDRKIVSATVYCKDGTSWDALKPKEILYDSAALSGICTNRRVDGKSYVDSVYTNINYDSYETKIVRESWSWSAIIYFIIVFFVGFGLIDAITLCFIYIFTGRFAIERSVLVFLLAVVMSSNDS